MLLSLIILGSSVAFNDIVLLSVVGLYSSYLLVCSLLLWRRLQGSIKPFDESTVFIGPGKLHWGTLHRLLYGFLHETHRH